jgi:uncharacterized membrane protein
MRRTLEIVALLLLFFLLALTAYAVAGPHPLPAKIPTHFNAAGQPDGWGTPAMLWMLPAIAGIIYLLMSLVARYPAAFHFPGRVRPPARRRLEAIALAMISWIKVEVLGLFAWIQYETVAFARQGQGTLSPAFLPIVLLVVFGTIAVHVVALRRAARG